MPPEQLSSACFSFVQGRAHLLVPLFQLRFAQLAFPCQAKGFFLGGPASSQALAKSVKMKVRWASGPHLLDRGTEKVSFPLTGHLLIKARQSPANML